MSTTDPLTPTLTQRLARTSVRDAMQPGLLICSPEDPIETVAGTMARESIHCVVVAGVARRDHSGEQLGWGIVSDLDLMAALDPDVEATTAGEIAGTEIVTVSPLDPLGVAARLMVEHDTAHVVVVSPETGRPLGMLSTLDVARAAAGA
jgi:CBS domain-containing protein